MGSFFKMFFASLLAFVVFFFIVFFLLFAIVASIASKDKPEIADKSVLVLDLSKYFNERKQPNPFATLSGDDEIPGLYDVIRMINHAKTDENIAGIYITANTNANGFGASNELRNALLNFKSSKKFIIAYGDAMSQGAYFVANVANKVYVNPAGGFDWSGFNVSLAFLKGTLEKLQIEPQIFYAGKFKSATEPFRATEMTPENELQTKEWLNDLYYYFLVKTSEARKVDTATLHRLANTAAIQTPEQAVQNRLIDGVKYDDEVKSEIKNLLKSDKYDKLHLVSLGTYSEAINFKRSGKDRIALIYAEGDILDGEGDNGSIGGDRYAALIRKARLDKSVKAIVLRVNSGGGSALASEKIWRELEMAQADKKPVVVSFGDVAASGGYYIACGADSIFAQPNTITGSIGVFGIIPNMKGFFNNKLGITFDGVKTAEYADAGAVYRPLNEKEKAIVQNSVDRIYLQFKQRVAEGRKKDINYVDSIAQGRVWSGEDALRLGLVDRLGTLDDAVRAAAKLAKTDDYRLREYPESKSWFNELLGKEKETPSALLRKEIGEENYRIYKEFLRVKEMSNSVQARLPYHFFIH